MIGSDFKCGAFKNTSFVAFTDRGNFSMCALKTQLCFDVTFPLLIFVHSNYMVKLCGVLGQLVR